MVANSPGRATLAVATTAKALALDRSGAEVIGSFSDFGVPVVIMKGPVFAEWLYGDGAMRPYGDIDLLVPPWGFERAEEVLAHTGFRRRHRRAGEPGQASYASNWVRRDSERIDLHHTLSEAGAPAQLVWDRLEPHRTAFRLAGTSVTAFDPPACAVVVALHATHHGIDEPKPLEDLRRAVQSASLETWVEASSIAEAIGAEEAFAAGVRLDAAGARLADELGLVSRFSRSVQLRAGGRQDAFTLTIERLLHEPGVARKASYVWLHLFPPAERMRAAYPLARRGAVPLGLSYLWRPVRRLPASLGALDHWMRVDRLARKEREASRTHSPAGCPKVTYIGNFLHCHGLNPTYAESLVPRLRAAGVDVVVASTAIRRSRRMLDQLSAIWRSPRRGGLVVVDLYGGARAFPAGVVAVLACRLLRRRYAVALHGGSLPDRIKGRALSVRVVVGGATHIIAPSQYLADAFSALSPVHVIPNGVQTSSLPSVARAQVRPFLLYLRAYSREYGALTMVRAFSLLAKAFPDAMLTMVGPDLDGSRGDCEALAQELGVRDKVTFVGRVPKTDVAQLGADHDIFVNPTTVDNTPVSVVEAMAMGMCIVASNVGGLPALLDHGRLGLLVSPSAEDLAEGMAAVLREPRAALDRAAAATRAAKLMDWSEVVPRWLDLLGRA